MTQPIYKLFKTFQTKDLQAINEVVTELLNQENGFNKQDSYGKNVLMYACEFGDYDLLKKILALPLDIDSLDKQENSALIYAARMDNFDLARKIMAIIIDKGAEIDNIVNKQGETALSIVSKRGNQACIDLLCSRLAERTQDQIYASLTATNTDSNNRLVINKRQSRKTISTMLANMISFLFNFISYPFKLIGSLFGCIRSDASTHTIKFNTTIVYESKYSTSEDNENSNEKEILQLANDTTILDAELTKFAQGMKAHFHDIVIKTEAIIKDRELKKMPDPFFNDVMHSLCVLQQRDGGPTLQQRFDSYNCDKNLYAKTKFFKLCIKYIEYIHPRLDRITQEFNSLTTSAVDQDANQSAVNASIIFSSKLSSDNKYIPTLASLTEKFNTLSKQKRLEVQ